MLYVTTRNDQTVFTAQRALTENRGPDGGMYVPFRDPEFTAEDIALLKNKTFSQCVADALNRLFDSNITSWDVDFSIGRYAVRLKMLGSRIVMGQLWHNLESDFPRIVNNLTNLLRNDGSLDAPSADWADIGIRIAVLFGIFGELMRSGIAGKRKTVDISVFSGDFSAPISAWYARKWGLPIGNIICACNENSNLWDFVCHGQLKTGEIAAITDTPLGDYVAPEGLERLIYAVGGVEEVERYLAVLRSGGVYYMEEALLNRMRDGLYVTVTSGRRLRQTIPTVFSTHRYVLSPYSALAYAGLQDYRVRKGESGGALILEERSPLLDAEFVSASLGIDVDTLQAYLK